MAICALPASDKKGRGSGPCSGVKINDAQPDGCALYLPIFAKAATNHHKEHRHEEDRRDRRGHHPAHYACTDGVLRTGAGAGADN